MNGDLPLLVTANERLMFSRRDFLKVGSGAGANCCDSVANNLRIGKPLSELHHPGERRFGPAASELLS